jgi:transcriptional regulator with XRE-family HTH domain
VSKTSEREAAIARLIELIQAERLRQKLSLNEVATRSGLSHTMIMRVEKRERLPTIDTLLRISDALEIDLSSMLKRAIGNAKRSGAAKH